MTIRLLETHAPWIAAFPTHAHSLSVLGDNPKSNKWFYENYVQLVARPGRPNVFNSYVNYYSPYPWIACPALESSDIPTNVVQLGWTHFHEFAMDMINERYFIIAYLDRFYLDGLSDSGMKHYAHDTMLYGFDNVSKIFYTKDYYDGIYKTMGFSFENVDNSFKSSNYSKEICDDFHGVLIMKPRDTFECSFDMNRYKQNIYNYLTSSVGNVRPYYGYKEHNFLFPAEYAYGDSVFDMLHNYLDTKIELSDYNLDIRGFCTIYEYAQIITLTAKFIETQYDVGLFTLCERIARAATKLRNLVLLSCQTKNADRLVSSLELLTEIRDMIKEHYENMLKI